MAEKQILKSHRCTGYHSFYASVVGAVQENPDLQQQAPMTIGEMSKAASVMWKQCTQEVREDWKKEGQRRREDIDCGIEVNKCSKCGKIFKRKKDLSYHKKGCGECECCYCLKKFSSKDLLNKHIKKHSDEHLKCVQCGKRFSSNQAKKRHESVHSKEKEFQCSFCRECFTIKHNLARHVKNCHNNAMWCVYTGFA